MPHFVVDKVQSALNDHVKPLRNSHVHIEEIAYKRDIDDVRESPALDVIHLLQSRGARVTYFDSYIPKVQVHSVELSSTDVAAEADCVVIITDHRTTDYAALVDKSKLIVDTRNALKGLNSSKIVRL
jgi:UDP-N-acetyl-D-glucosamine dehydrogenase